MPKPQNLQTIAHLNANYNAPHAPSPPAAVAAKQGKKGKKPPPPKNRGLLEEGLLDDQANVAFARQLRK
jgi:hypothetical protein